MTREFKPIVSRFGLPVAAALFGLMTLMEGGSLIRSLSREEMVERHIVPTVLYFNVASGLAYVAIAVVALRWRGRSFVPAAVLALLISGMGIFLGVHILSGGEYLGRTVGAMTVRFFFWLGFSLWAWRGRQASEE